MNILNFITMIMLLIILALVLEKAIHWSFSLKELVIQLKADIKSFFVGLFVSEPERHNFNPMLREEFRDISEPYTHRSFGFDCCRSIKRITEFPIAEKPVETTITMEEYTAQVSAKMLEK